MILPDLPKTETLEKKQELLRLLLSEVERLVSEIKEEMETDPPLEFLADSIIRCGKQELRFPPRRYAVIEFVYCSSNQAAI